MADMSQQEISEFLSEPHVAHLATVRPDRRPHLAPVVYFEENGKAFVMVPANVVKLRNVRRNPKVSLSIATDQRPYKYVVLEGQGRVTDDNLKWSSATLFRAFGPELGPDYARQFIAAGGLLILEVQIHRVLSSVVDE